MKTLKNFEFVSAAKSNYDWDKLLDGGIYQAEAGKDFECQPQTFAMLARKNAQKRDKLIQISQDEEKGTVTIKASDMNAEQKKANQAKIAKAKAAKAAKNGDGDEGEGDGEGDE